MEIILDEQVKKCPCCDSKNSSFWWDSQKIYFGLDIQYNKCNDCGAYFQVKRIATKRLKDFYTSYYRDNYLHQFEGYNDERDRQRQLQRFTYMMKAVDTIVPNFNYPIGYYLGVIVQKG